MKKNLLKSFALAVVAMLSISASAQTETTYAPTLDVDFRTVAGNTAWNSGFPKSAADEGNKDFELTYTAGLFALQKYTVAELKNATKLVLTLTVGSKSGVDAVRLWSFPNTTWTAESGVDDIVPVVTSVVGIAPRDTEGTPNEPLVKGSKVKDSDPAKVTYTIQGAALSTIKANADADGTFTLLLTNDKLTDTSNKRSYLSINSENAEENRPTLVVTAETPSVVNTTTGEGYASLSDAFAAAVAADADAVLEVSADQKLTARLTWNVAHSISIIPTKDITINNCSTTGNGLIENLREANDALYLKGFLNVEGCTGTTIYTAKNRIRMGDPEGTTIYGDFTATNTITVGTAEANYVEGTLLIVKVGGAYADKFKPAKDGWYFARTATNGDMKLTQTEPTGISATLMNNEIVNSDVYDLQGRKVNGQSSMVNGQLKKGLYIINGRKMISK